MWPAGSHCPRGTILLDLFTTRGDLDQIPVGLEALLRPGTHPAFNGFSAQALKSARAGLVGRTYMELARIMMGRTGADNQVYNAACNVIMASRSALMILIMLSLVTIFPAASMAIWISLGSLFQLSSIITVSKAQAPA